MPTEAFNFVFIFYQKKKGDGPRNSQPRIRKIEHIQYREVTKFRILLDSKRESIILIERIINYKPTNTTF